MPTIDNVSLDITVVLGTTAMPVHQVLRLGRGAIIELDASEDDEVQILANNLPVARGTVVVQGNRIAVEVRELLPRGPTSDRRRMLWRSANRPAGKLRQVRRVACWGAALGCQPRPFTRGGRFVTSPAPRTSGDNGRRSSQMRPWRNW